ncbi:hypothetical protein D3C74_412700 [compost metagenome]
MPTRAAQDEDAHGPGLQVLRIDGQHLGRLGEGRGVVPVTGLQTREREVPRGPPGRVPRGLAERVACGLLVPRAGQDLAQEVVGLAVPGVGVAQGQASEGCLEVGPGVGVAPGATGAGGERHVGARVVGVAPQRLLPVGLGRAGRVPVLAQV